MKVKLTKNDAQEVFHKLHIVQDERDLRDDYNLTSEQISSLVKSIPRQGGEWVVPEWAIKSIPRQGGEWVIPEWAIEVVKWEMQDHAIVLGDIASDARNGGQIGQSLALYRQATKFEKMFK